jgi:hypothetical protein
LGVSESLQPHLASKALAFLLSTPFWEFLGEFRVVKNGNEINIILELSTPFWEFLVADLTIRDEFTVNELDITFYSLLGVSVLILT